MPSKFNVYPASSLMKNTVLKSKNYICSIIAVTPTYIDDTENKVFEVRL